MMAEMARRPTVKRRRSSGLRYTNMMNEEASGIFPRVFITLLAVALSGCEVQQIDPGSCKDGLILRGCGLDTPDIVECFRLAWQFDIGQLANGSKPLGLPKIDPLHVKEMRINLTCGRTILLLDMKVTGLANIRVEALNSTVPPAETQGIISYTFYVDLLTIQSRYILVNSLGSKTEEGSSTIVLRGYRAFFALNVQVIEEDGGDRFYFFTRSQSRIDSVSDIVVSFTDLEGNTRPQLKIESTEDRNALKYSINQKQNVINFAAVIRLYKNFPQLKIWQPPNVNGTIEFCLRKRQRIGVSAADVLCYDGY